MTTTTAPLQAKSLDVPDQTIAIGSVGTVELVNLGAITVGRATFQPGFHWTEHFREQAGTALCMVPHVGYVVSGRAGIRMADGTERELAAGDAFDVPPGHDAWTIGDVPYIAVDVIVAAASASGAD